MKNYLYIYIVNDFKTFKHTQMKTRKIEFYANGIEVLPADHSVAKEVLIGMPTMRGKLSGYGAWTEKKASNSGEKKEVDRFVSNGFEFIVFTYEAMDFCLSSITLSESKLCTAVYWQKIK